MSDNNSNHEPDSLLENEWTLWLDRRILGKPAKPQTEDAWKNSLEEIHSISTIYEFWNLQNTLVEPSNLADGYSFYFFKKDIVPLWEKDPNVGGGRWTISVETANIKLDNKCKSYAEAKNIVDNRSNNYWIRLLECLIGEQYDDLPKAKICGIVFNKRKEGNRISIWTTNGKERDEQMILAKKFKEVLMSERSDTEAEKVCFTYFLHDHKAREYSI